ncbi:MAG: hypothetical protein JNM76_17035 [Betaproteobacteria bacterium]|nr:hypothetical protein [Betaproteobacteria bacterium]
MRKFTAFPATMILFLASGMAQANSANPSSPSKPPGVPLKPATTTTTPGNPGGVVDTPTVNNDPAPRAKILLDVYSVGEFKVERKVPEKLKASVRAFKNNAPIEGARITYRLNSSLLGTATTGSDGIAALDFTTELPPGLYDLDLETHPLPGQNFGSGAKNAKLKIENMRTVLTLEAVCQQPYKKVADGGEVPCPSGANVQISGKLTRFTDGLPLSGRPVAITLGGAALAPQTTNAGGLFNYTHQMGVAPKTLFQAAFAGDENAQKNFPALAGIQLALPGKITASWTNVSLLNSLGADAPKVGLVTPFALRVINPALKNDCHTSINQNANTVDGDCGLAGVAVQVDGKSYVSAGGGVVKGLYVPKNTMDFPNVDIVDANYVKGTEIETLNFQNPPLVPGPVVIGVHDVPAKAKLGAPFNVRITLQNGATQLLDPASRIASFTVSSGFVIAQASGDQLTIKSTPGAVPIAKTLFTLSLPANSSYLAASKSAAIEITP